MLGKYFFESVFYNRMNSCPCCSQIMLRHVRQHQVYWFCRNCWQEMPLLDHEAVHQETSPSDNLGSNFHHSLFTVS